MNTAHKGVTPCVAHITYRKGPMTNRTMIATITIATMATITPKARAVLFSLPMAPLLIRDRRGVAMAGIWGGALASVSVGGIAVDVAGATGGSGGRGGIIGAVGGGMNDSTGAGAGVANVSAGVASGSGLTMGCSSVATGAAGAVAADDSLAIAIGAAETVAAMGAGGSRSARRVKYCLMSMLAAPLATCMPRPAIAPPSCT